MRARSRASVLLLAFIAACSGSAPSSVPTAPVTPGTSPLASVDATQSAVSSAAPSTAASLGAAPSVEPSLTPTIEPTAKPSTPKPEPTLDWETIGYAQGFRSPVDLGAKARVTIDAPHEVRCSIKVTYPNGSNASLPDPARPDPGKWVWTWTVPKSATSGTAHVKTSCTYLGLAKTGTGTFKIRAPEVPSNWSINANMPSTLDSENVNSVPMTVHLNGTLPIVAGHPYQWVVCSLSISSGSGHFGASANGDYTEPDADTLYLQYDSLYLGPAFIGTGTWTMQCRNNYVTPADWKVDSGTIEIT
jgi:hypothetical protein